MTNSKTQEVCGKCGKLMRTDNSITLSMIVKLNHYQPVEYFSKLCEWTSDDAEAVQDYIGHRMGHNCISTTVAACPACGCVLKTWKAKHCLSCDWTRSSRNVLAEYKQL